jgi:hypothetical protein
MTQQTLRFRILLIDDDFEMNAKLERLLSNPIAVDHLKVIPQVDYVDVRLEEDNNRKGYWNISETTLKQLQRYSRFPNYDLVMVDFGFATEEAKDILWGKDRTRTPTKEEAKGRLLTIRDLQIQYEDWQNKAAKNAAKNNNVFTAARRVILRSFASRMAFDMLGPVEHSRRPETQKAFPNADVIAIDSRQEFFGGDEFYDIIERPDGRDYYRYLVGTYSKRVIESEVLRRLIKLSGKLQVRRSVLNIALFAGSIAVIGGVSQYLANLGFGFLDRGQSVGWWFFIAGLLALISGALTLALSFEWFARAIVRWIGPEEEFGRE